MAQRRVLRRRGCVGLLTQMVVVTVVRMLITVVSDGCAVVESELATVVEIDDCERRSAVRLL